MRISCDIIPSLNLTSLCLDSYWDISLETSLFDDSAAVEILFLQVPTISTISAAPLRLPSLEAQSDLKYGPVRVSADVVQKLRTLEAEGSKREWLRLAGLQRLYGYLELEAGVADWPEPESRVRVLLGARQLLLCHTDAASGEERESLFKLTRVRTFKVLYQPDSASFSFSFEYMLARDSFQWIALATSQPVLLCQCLQSMGSEMLASLHGQQSLPPSSPLASPAPQPTSSRYESFRDVIAAAIPRVGSASFPSVADQTTNNAFDTFTDDDL